MMFRHCVLAGLVCVFFKKTQKPISQLSQNVNQYDFENATITHCRPTIDIIWNTKSHVAIAKTIKATSSLYFSEMIAKLEKGHKDQTQKHNQ